MKLYLLILITSFFTSYNTYGQIMKTSQMLHDILVPNTVTISIDDALSEFAWYHQNRSMLSFDNAYIETEYNITWPQNMLMWEGEGWGNIAIRPYTKWTAAAVMSYARAYRFEQDPILRAAYMEKAILEAEFLLCMQSQTPGVDLFTG